MGGRRWLNLALCAAVIALAALLLLEPDLASPPTRAPVSALAIDGVRRIDLRNRAGAVVSLEHAGTGWQLTAPIRARANAIKVSEALAVAAAPSLAHFPAEGRDLGEFGLAPPRVELSLDGERFAIGDTEPLDGRRYVLHEEQIHLVEDRFRTLASAGAASLVDPAPVGGEAKVVGLDLPAGSMRWDGERWHTQGLGELGADRLNEVAHGWTLAQAVLVAPMAPRARWTGQVSVWVEGTAAPLEFLSRWTEHELVLARPALGIQYHLLRRPMTPLMDPRDAPH